MTDIERPDFRRPDGDPTRPRRSVTPHLRGVGRALVVVCTIAWFLFAAVVIVLRDVVLPQVAGYRPLIERLASQALGETVRIGEVDASWRGLQPAFTLRALQITETRAGADGASVLELPSVRATLSWESLLLFRLRLASLDVDGPQLTVRRDADGQLFVAGFPIRRKATPDNRLGEWLLAQQAIHIRHARITWQDEMPRDAAAGPPERASGGVVLSDVDFALVRSGWRHRAALRAVPPADLAAPIDVRAVIDHPLLTSRFAEPDDWQGELYVDLASGDLAAWRAVLPLPPTLESGHGRVRAWLAFSQASAPAGRFAQQLAGRTQRAVPQALDRIASITADLALDDVAVRWADRDYAAPASIDGRITTSQSQTEQRFAALHMALQPRSGPPVPATDFRIERTIGPAPDDEAGRASLGAIDIGVSIGLLPDAFVPPVVVEKLATLKPSGKLDSMTVVWTGPIVAPKTFRIDVGFEQLSMAAQAPSAESVAIASQDIVVAGSTPRKRHPPFGRPGFENFGGTLSATRSATTGGATGATGANTGTATTTRLAIDVRGTDSTVTAPGLFDDPVLRLAHVEAQVGVVFDGDDVEVKVAHASLDNADVAGTVALTFRHGPHSSGASVDDGTGGGRGWIDLDAHLTRADVARVPRYLPNIIGPKARAYLSKSLVAGTVTEASFTMRGALERLDLRAMPGAAATPYAVPIANALVATRDAPAGTARRPTIEAGPPASPDQAIFHALVKVQGATFLYGPARDPETRTGVAATTGQPVLPSIAWPAFEDLDADIVFDQANLTVRGHSMRVYGFRLNDVTAELPALTDPAHVLRVTGRGNGPLQDLVRFINNSPVAQWTRHFTETSQGSGNARLALALDLPITHPRDAEVAGSLQFVADDLALNAVIPPFRRIDGRLDFTDRGMTINGMTAQTLGGPLRIDASTGRDGYIDLNAEGTIDLAALKASVHEDASATLPAATATPVANVLDRASPWLSGGARYTVGVRVRNKRVADLAADAPTITANPRGAADAASTVADDPRETGEMPDILIRSDLVGLASTLPAPLAKGAADVWPLRIAISRKTGATMSDSEDLRITLADVIDADILRLSDAQGQLAVSRAGYRIGAAARGERAITDGPSAVRIRLPKLDVDAWRDVARQIAAVPRPSPEPAAAATTGGLDNLLPGEVSLRTPLLHAAGRDFDDVSIDARRLPSGWQADVVADQVAGRLSYTDVSGTTAAKNGVVPVSSGRVVARLSRLTIPRSDATNEQVEDRFDANRQKDFPAIDLVADRFELRGRSLGRLEVVAKNVGDGDDRAWQLEKLGLTTPEADFAAHGAWGHRSGAENTHLDFDLQASDVGALMDRFGLTRTIKNGTAHLTGDVGWNGGPSTIDFASMEGSLRLAADKGQFLKADPGIAKLLNILSLQGLARRLTLDFDDVFDAGFAFDTVRADATVQHGIASTSDFTMRGVQATVTMSGTADLERETTDLHVRVAPQINAGAASLGVAVINPVVGLATFAAQYLFKDRISQALSFEYNVVGPWAKPDVTKIDHNGKVTTVVPRTTPPVRDGDAASKALP